MARRTLSAVSSLTTGTNLGDDNELFKQRLVRYEFKLEQYGQQIVGIKEALELLTQQVNENPGGVAGRTRKRSPSEGTFIPVQTLKNLKSDLNSKVAAILQNSRSKNCRILEELR
jgi:hypothetical protein